MTPKIKQLSESRFNLFDHSVNRAISKLGLGGWYVQIGKKQLSGSDAEMSHSADAKRAFILINTKDDHESDNDVKNSAYHEAVELMLSPLEDRRNLNLPKKEWESARHDVVHRVVRLLEIIDEKETQKRVKK